LYYSIINCFLEPKTCLKRGFQVLFVLCVDGTTFRDCWDTQVWSGKHCWRIGIGRKSFYGPTILFVCKSKSLYGSTSLFYLLYLWRLLYIHVTYSMKFYVYYVTCRKGKCNTNIIVRDAQAMSTTPCIINWCKSNYILNYCSDIEYNIRLSLDKVDKIICFKKLIKNYLYEPGT